MGMLSEKRREIVEREVAKTLPPENLMYRGGRKAVYIFLRFLMRILFRMEVDYPERLPKEGPVLLCGNHTHYLDLPLIHFQFDRWIYWVARESLFDSAFTSRFFPWWGTMPIDVRHPDASQIKRILGAIKKNQCVGIFPQGTRCQDPEKVRSTVPRTGAVSFAIRTEATIVPIAVDGEFKLFRKVKLRVGEPYKLDIPKKTRITEEELMTLTIDLMENIFSLMGQEYPLQNKSQLTGGRKADYVEK